MGHSWPGSDKLITWPTEGNKNRDISANEEILNFFNLYENPLVNLAYGKSLEVYPKYISPQQGDTLKLIAQISNPENHQVVVYAFIHGANSTFKDSVQLFDDGLHGDENESDNIFGESKWYSDLEEDFYTVKLYAEDLDESITTNYSGLGQFTTAGPVVIDSCSLEHFMGTMYKLKLY